MRKPRGFSAWKVPIGVLFVREEDGGGWVILCAEPAVKIDNKHLDGRPHMHVGGWDSTDRRPLRATLTATQAAAAVARQLRARGTIDPAALEEQLR